MDIWITNHLTAQPVKSFPRLLSVACQRQNAPTYHHEGRYRQREKICLFKYTLRGEGVFRDATGEHRISSGSGFLCRINDPETAYYYPEGGTRLWEFVYVTFSGANTMDMVEDMTGCFGPVYRIDRRDPAMQRILSCEAGGRVQQQITAGEGARVVVDLLTALAATRERVPQQDPDNLLVMRAVQTIRNSLDVNMNVTELASELGCSREHLSRVFRVQAGVTPYRYIMSEKARLAGYMLRQQKLSVKEIASKLGFEHAAHFTRVFKEYTGTTPSRYRSQGSGEV